jgi:hypothetical protein
MLRTGLPGRGRSFDTAAFDPTNHAARADNEPMPTPAFRRNRARPVRAGDGLRVGGFVLVAIQLVLALGALATAAEAKQDRSYGGDRSSIEDRSDRHDRSSERDSSEAGDRSYGRSFSRGRSNEQRGWGDRRGSGDGRSGGNDRSQSDDRGRRDSDDQGEDDRGDSGNGDRRSWDARDDDRREASNDNRSDRRVGEAGGDNQSSRRIAEADDDGLGSFAIPPPDETSVDGQSVGPTPPAASPDSTAAPQTQAPTGDSSPGGSSPGNSRPGRRAGGGGDRASRRDGNSRGGNRGAGTFAGPVFAPLALLPPTAGDGPPAAADGDAASRQDQGRDETSNEAASPVVRTVRDIVEIVPSWMKWAIAGLAALSLLLAGGYALSALRARQLARQRAELLGEVGLLQAALLPAVPDELTEIGATVAYAPADGPGAGGDFYDVLPLAEDRTGFILGDLSGHGREAIERTAFMRYTLRAYLEAGLEPAAALAVAGRVIGDNLDGDFATVLLAVHDPRDSSLTFASAGHPPPIVVGGGASFEPVLAGGSPPLGIGEPTGMRQTTVPLASRSVACLYTDGLSEARTADGVLGEERLEQIVAGLGPDATARQLLDAVAAEAVATPDDMATCLLSPKPDIRTGGFRTERLELSADELDGPLLERFLTQCDVPAEQRAQAGAETHEIARQSGGALVTVVFGSRRAVEVLPRNVTLLDAASRRAA